MNSRRAWLVFAVALAVYMVAVLQRSSLGVAAVQATDRFDIQAAALSSIAVLQLVVYAGLQIPVGVMVDRVGPRFLLTSGAALMCLGQVTFAVAPSLGVAIVARVLVGAGDAMTFISAVRLLATWFDGRSLPIATQLLGGLGAFGQVLSAFPLAFALHQWGWTPAYLGAATISAIAAVVVVTLVADSPRGAGEPVREWLTWRASLVHLRESIARPGTQLGFWAHFVLQSSLGVFLLLWGFPFLSIGLGYGPQLAALLLSISVISGAVSGPGLGLLIARFPLRRSNLVLAIVIAMAIAWAVVLSWPGRPPLWAVVVLILVISIGGPGSMVGFDYARSFNPLRAFGSASGAVNVGGFLATFTMMLLIGVVLDVIDRSRGGSGVPAELYSFDSFRVAFLIQYVVIGAGVVLFLHARRRTRRRLQEDEGIEVAPLWVSLLTYWRRRRA
jgi:sugar phosphate permease